MANANSQTITPQDQLAMAGQLRQEKMGGGEKAEPAGEVADQQPRTLREQIMAARRAMDVKQMAKDKVQKKITMPAEKTFKAMLRCAWRITFSVIGFLPGLLYINLHAFLRLAGFPSFFCELGKEWQPEQMRIQQEANNVTSAAGIGASVGEKSLLAFLDFLLLLIIFVVLVILVWVADNIVLKGMIWVWDLTN